MADTYSDAYDISVKLKVDKKDLKDFESNFVDGKLSINVNLDESYTELKREIEQGFTTSLKINIDRSNLDQIISTNSLENLKQVEKELQAVSDKFDELSKGNLKLGSDRSLQTIAQKNEEKFKNIYSLFKQYDALIHKAQSISPGYDPTGSEWLSVSGMNQIGDFYDEGTIIQRIEAIAKAKDIALSGTDAIAQNSERIVEAAVGVQEKIQEEISPITIKSFVVGEGAISNLKEQIESELRVNLDQVISGESRDLSGDMGLSADNIGNAIVNAIQSALDNASFEINNANIKVDNGNVSANSSDSISSGSGNSSSTNVILSGATSNSLDSESVLKRYNGLIKSINASIINLWKNASSDDAYVLIDRLENIRDELIGDAQPLVDKDYVEGTDEFITQVNVLDKAINKFSSDVDKMVTGISEVQMENFYEKTATGAEKQIVSAIKVANSALSKSLSIGRTGVEGSESLSGQYKAISDDLKTVIEQTDAEPTIENINRLSEALGNARKSMAELEEESIQLNNTMQTQNAIDAQAKSSVNLQIQLENLRKKIKQYGITNTAFQKDSFLKSQYDSLVNRAENLDISNPIDIKKLNEDFTKFQQTIITAGKTGQSAGDRIKGMFEKFGGWSLVTRSMTKIYSLIRKIGTAVKELDTAMVNLKKVSNASAEDYAKFLTRATESAQKLGTSITDLVDATAEFSRLGYNLDDSATLGEYATLYSRVAEDLTASDAAQSIVSTMKAFKMAAEDAINIVDLFNYVGRIIAQVCVNVYKQIAISVKSQRWSRPRKDLFIGIRNDCNTLRGNTSGFAILEDTV